MSEPASNSNLSLWSIRNPIYPIAIFLALCILGLSSFQRLPVTQMPNIDVPVVQVSVSYPGAGPVEMVNQIIRPIEDAVANVAGAETVEAAAQDGAASVNVTFNLGVDTNQAVADVKDAVAQARLEMPSDVRDPVVRKLDVTGLPMMFYALSDESLSLEALTKFIDDTITRELISVEGVGEVNRFGDAARQISIDMDPDRLLALGMTVAGVSQQLAAVNVDLGGGKGQLAGQDYAIRTLGSAKTIADLAALYINLPGGGTVRLDQIAEIRDEAAEPTSFALFDGRPVVAIGITRATGASDVTAAKNVKERIERIRTQYPALNFNLIDDSTIYTEGNYETAMSTLYEGAALAIIVVLLFLRNWRATIITAVALPLSILPTYLVMEMLGFSLNTVSLLGITLVTGILVDDAIVEIENTVRHINMGKTAYEAAEEASSEIGNTVIAISLTIIAVFLPVAFMPGIAGEFFRQFGLTVSAAVLWSLFVARMITPMFAAYFLRGAAEPEEERDGLFLSNYMKALRWTLRNRITTLVAGIAVFALSIWSATLLPTEFLPPIDVGRSAVSIELPPGSTLDQTRVAARDLSERIRQRIPETKGVFVMGLAAGSATVVVNYGQKNERDRGFQIFEEEIRAMAADVPDSRVFVLGPTGTRAVEANILGDTHENADEAARLMAAAMKGIPSLGRVSSSAAMNRPEIRLTPRPDVAASLGVNSVTLGSTIRVATIGDFDQNLAKFSTGDERVPIVVRVDPVTRSDITRLAGLQVPSASGALVPIGAVADLSISGGPTLIKRYERRYSVGIGADVAPGAYLSDVTSAVAALPVLSNLPDGTELKASGDIDTMGDIFSSFATAMTAGVLAVYLLLVLLFRSFVTPITILVALPLAIGGAIFALWIYGAAIGLSVAIGFLMLMGIVTKNSIMLVEFALEQEDGGIDRHDAILDAAHKRARPIIMTTLAMSAGMLPSALGHGLGGEFRAPMAIAVIGGLLVSTVLTLLFVPALYSVIEQLRDFLRRQLGKVFYRETRPDASGEQGADGAASI